MASKLDKHIDTITDAYSEALNQILIEEEGVEEAQQRLDDLDELRARLKDKRGQNGDIVSEAVTEIGGERAERLARLLELPAQEAQKADLVEKQGDRDLFFMLKFKSSEVLERFRDYASEYVDARGIEWHDPEDYHITLVFVPGLDLIEATELSLLVNTADAVSAEVDGFGSFTVEDGADKHTLFLKVRPTDELRDLQRRLYELAVSKGHKTSPFSLPERWKPHITVATAEEPFDLDVLPEVGGAVPGSAIVASVDFNVIAASMEQAVMGIDIDPPDDFATPPKVLQDIPAPELKSETEEEPEPTKEKSLLDELGFSALLDSDSLYDIIERGYVSQPGDLDGETFDMLVDLITDELSDDAP